MKSTYYILSSLLLVSIFENFTHAKDGKSIRTGASFNNEEVKRLAVINERTLSNEAFKITTSDQQLNRARAAAYNPPAVEKQITNTTFRQCKDYAQSGYECVNFIFCNEQAEIITDGGPVIQIRSGLVESKKKYVNIEKEIENSKCAGDMEVCCRDANRWEPVVQAVEPPPYQAKCGRRNREGYALRIKNNKRQISETQFGEWPHTCLLGIMSNERLVFKCGASLIHENIVMTAAHCVKNLKREDLAVRCGEWDALAPIEPLPSQTRGVSKVTIHPGYNRKNLTNNIALLFVDEPFELIENVDTICLPSQQQEGESMMNDDHKNKMKETEMGCYATGWGKDEFTNGKYQTTMKKVRMNLINSEACEVNIDNVLKYYNISVGFNLEPTALCAGGVTGQDTCSGDGGGPLVCPSGEKYVDASGWEEDVYVQRGIVGWGFECGLAVPGVYTDVRKQLCFIQFASKCFYKSDKMFPDIMCDDDWSIREREKVADAYRGWEYKLKTDFLSSRGKERVKSRMEAHAEVVKKWDEEINVCSEPESDFDLSSYEKTEIEAIPE